MELCRCGRPITYKPHCPYCGSTFVMAKTASGAWTKNAKGEQYWAKGFRCRRCTGEFNQADECNAEPVERVRGEAAGLPAQLMEAVSKDADAVAVSVGMRMEGMRKKVEERPPGALEGEEERFAPTASKDTTRFTIVDFP